MKKIFRGLILILILLPILTSATTYYVSTTGSDTNPGTQTQPWKTIAKVSASSFSPGDFILFKRGETWSETLIPPSSGSAANPITFGAYGTGNKPIIDGTGLNFCITDSVGKGYITIDGFELTNPNKFCVNNGYWSGGVEGSTPSWTIQNCTFTHCGVRLFGPNAIVQDNVFIGPSPITTGDGAAVIIRGAVAVNCSILRNTISGYNSRGIWFLISPDSPTVNDNVIYDIGFVPGGSLGGFGIDFDGYGTSVIGTATALRNTIYDCASYGMLLENSKGSLINRNLIHDCPTGIGYTAYAEHLGLDVGAVITHNIIYHCTYGIRLDDVSDVDIWNNVIYDGVGTYPGSLMIFDNGAYYVTDIDFRNNIVSADPSKSVSAQFAREIHFSAFDYNAVENTVIQERDTSTNLNLAQLQAEGAALNCFTTDPGFVNAAGHDFHLQSTSPCINKGTNVGLTRDYEGNTVPQGTAPDIGTYEYPGNTPPPCFAVDINCDNTVDVTDLIIVASDFGKTSDLINSKSDTNGDNIVDIYDVVYVASRFT